MDRVSHDIMEIRSRVCNVSLVVLAITSIPTLAGSLYRITTIGWLPVMAVHIFLAMVLCFFAFFRNRMPYNLRAGYVVTVFFVVGFGALWQFGLIAPGIPFFVAAPAISIVFFGTRAGFVVLVASLLAGSMIGVFTVLEHRLPPFDLSFYATQPSSWVLMIIAWVMVGGSLLVVMVLYNRDLIAALGDANQHQGTLVENESRFRDFADAASDVFWETGADHRLSFLSTSADFLSVDAQKEAIGQTLWELAGADPSQDEAWARHREAMLAYEPFRDFRYSARIGGQIFHWRTSGKPIFEAGAFAGYRGSAINETGEVLAQQRLQDVEVRFLNAVENLSEGLALWDVDDRLIFCNKQYREFGGTAAAYLRFGGTFAEYLRDTVKNGQYPAAIGREKEWIEERLARHRDLPSTTEIQLAGNVLIVHEEHTPDGGVIATVTDITERKRAERLFIEQKQLLQAVVDAVPAIITVKDRDLLYLMVNQVQAEEMGCTPEEAIGKHRDAFPRRGISSEEGQRYTDVQTDWEHAVLRTGEARLFYEESFTYENGEVEHRLVNKIPLHDADGQIYAVLTVAMDITERKQAEEALRESEVRLSKAAEMAKIGYWVWDEVEDKAIYCSEEMAKMYCVASGDELAAKFSSHAADLEWIHPDDRERFNQAVLTARETKCGYDIEHRIVNAAGEIRHLHEIEEPVLDERGKIIRSNGIALDITEQKRVEERLRHAQKMEAVGQLTGGVAHDFNNILAIILGNLELLEDTVVCDDNCRNHIEMAVKATERGADLTQRLLAFSRRQALRPVPVDARKLIEDMLDLVRRSLGETVEIEIVVNAGLWATEIDPGQLENALLNLAINARDAMPDGGKLTIEASNARLTDEYATAQIDVAPGQYVLIAVSDTGSGMAPEVREQVFDPFFTTKEAGKGTGLGLSMVHGFVKQSGGHIAIYSEVGEGTTIKLYLPRYKGKKAALERRGQADELMPGKGEMILVVEDDADLRTMIINMLRSLGYGVQESGTGKSALDILKETADMNLLLTDVVLPGGMSGRTLADRAQEKNPNLPVLFMSGYTENAVIHHGRLDEGVQLLEKPFRKVDLARAVGKALDSEPT